MNNQYATFTDYLQAIKAASQYSEELSYGIYMSEEIYQELRQQITRKRQQELYKRKHKKVKDARHNQHQD